MCKLIAVVIAVLALCSCGDKVTNVTNVTEVHYTNGYYSCVGVWATDAMIRAEPTYITINNAPVLATYNDTTTDTLLLNEDKTWTEKVTHRHLVSIPLVVKAFSDTTYMHIDSGNNFIQNNRAITIFKPIASYSYVPMRYNLNMIDSSTIYSDSYIFRKIK